MPGRIYNLPHQPDGGYPSLVWVPAPPAQQGIILRRCSLTSTTSFRPSTCTSRTCLKQELQINTLSFMHHAINPRRLFRAPNGSIRNFQPHRGSRPVASNLYWNCSCVVGKSRGKVAVLLDTAKAGRGHTRRAAVFSLSVAALP